MSVLRRNNVTVRGHGPPMLFVHGYGCDQNMWRLLAPHFEGRFTTILVDLVGNGHSDLAAYDPAKYATLEGHAQDICEVLREAASQPAVCVGHSVSAMICMLANLKCPQLFAAQVMVAPSPCYINEGDYVGGFERSDIQALLDTLENNYLGWSSNMAPVIMGAPDQPELSTELANSFCRTHPEIAKQFARATFLSDHRADLPRLAVPTLILQCDDDAIAPMSVGQSMRQAIAGSRLSVIDNVGHCPHLSAPAETIEAIEEFLRQI